MCKRIIYGMMVLSMMVILTACGGGGKTESEQADIKIGHIVHMTGNAVEAGGNEKNGAELAAEQINAAGGINGRKLVFVQEDGKSSNAGVVAAFQKLLEDKEIVAIIGPTPSTQVTAMLPTIAEAKIPVATGGTNYGLTHSGCEWLFRFRPHDGISSKVMAKFAVENLKLQKVAILHSTDAFGSGGRDNLSAALKELGVTPVLIQGYNNDDKDYTAVITNIKKSGADVMISYMTMSPDVGIFAKQRKQQGLDIEWIGSSSITATAGRDLAGEALYGTYGVADFHAEASDRSKEYTAAYEAKYGVSPDFYSACTYDAVNIYAEAIKKAPDLTPDSIRQAILSIQAYEGAEGVYNFDQNGDGLDHYHVVINDNDTIKVVETIRAQR